MAPSSLLVDRVKPGYVAPEKPKSLKAVQLVIAPFSNAQGSTYSTLILADDGGVYRYDPHCEGWIPWPMTVADCRMEHKGKR